MFCVGLGRLKAMALVATTLFFAACGTQPQEPVTGVQSVGVISAIGDQLQVSYIGTTAFENKKAFSDISNWQLDKFITQHTEQKLIGKYTVRPVTFSKQGFIAENFGTFARSLDASDPLAQYRSQFHFPTHKCPWA